MMLVGLTGGIGSGKSTVCALFQLLDVPVYNSDESARNIMVFDKELRDRLISEFGIQTYLPDGQLNRPYLASSVFSDKQALQRLNQLVHPKVREDIQKWSAMQKTPYAIVESALLFENNFYRHFDAIISVIADLELRITRVVQRNNLTREEVLRRVHNQVNDEVRFQKSTYLIYNNQNNLLLPQVLSIHHRLWENLQNG